MSNQNETQKTNAEILKPYLSNFFDMGEIENLDELINKSFSNGELVNISPDDFSPVFIMPLIDGDSRIELGLVREWLENTSDEEFMFFNSLFLSDLTNLAPSVFDLLQKNTTSEAFGDMGFFVRKNIENDVNQFIRTLNVHGDDALQVCKPFPTAEGSVEEVYLKVAGELKCFQIAY